MLLLLIGICALVLYALSQGAPYVPTRRKDALQAIALMNLPKGATIVDVGAGDGAVLRVAAEQGYRAVGIEMNQLLVATARVRTWRYRGLVKIVRGNMWRWHLPPETTGVFLFTAGPFTGRMVAWLRDEQKRIGKPLIVVSLGFELPGEIPLQRRGACVRYIFT